MDSDDYRKYDGIGLARLVAAGEVSATELLAAARERMRLVNPRINAVVRTIDDEADAHARRPPDSGRPFDGVPFLIKDLYQDYAGHPTSGGSRSRSAPAAGHAAVVRRWIDAGLVIFGKTNTSELGAKPVTEPELFGPARNPWDLARTPGGSSGGAAAAVAAGIVPVAGASDGGGSIRIPAACCGLFGLKAGRGLVSPGPRHGELLAGLATEGVISRSVRDSAAMLDVLVGAEPTGPYAPGLPDSPYAAETDREPGRLRVGFYLPAAINPDPHPEARAAVTSAAKLLESLGHDVVELPRAPFDDALLVNDFLTMWFALVATQVGHDRDVEQDTLLMAALGRRTSGVRLLATLERRHDHVRRLAAFHAEHDLLLTPALATPPPLIGAFDLSRAQKAAGAAMLKMRATRLLSLLGLVDQRMTDNLGWIPYTQVANVTGRPAAAVPLHWTADGLPLGVQFVAAPGGEGTLLRLAAQLERALPWAERRPPVR